MNAYRYALLRMIERAKKLFVNDRVEPLEKELQLGWKVLAKAQALLPG